MFRVLSQSPDKTEVPRGFGPTWRCRDRERGPEEVCGVTLMIDLAVDVCVAGA